MSIVFDIECLECTYSREKPPVLEISDLQINQGELIFFLGASGVGKSTLIESLGLMTNTIEYTKKNSVKYSTSSKEIDLIDMWDESSHRLSKFRAEEFSFIFQSTNLFESVSLIDNIILPSFVGDIQKAKAEAEKYLKIFLPRINDYHTRHAGDLSGGQKQRLAFVRALTAKSRVLFCDEPTGNLDVGNASLVMKKLQQNITEHSSTALIVSHDIHLAIKFATRIILMTKEERDDGSSFGYINKQNQFIKNKQNVWKNVEGTFSDVKLIEILASHFEDCIEDE